MREDVRQRRLDLPQPMRHALGGNAPVHGALVRIAHHAADTARRQAFGSLDAHPGDLHRHRMPLPDELHLDIGAALRQIERLVELPHDSSALGGIRVGDEIALEELPLPLDPVLRMAEHHEHHHVVVRMGAGLIQRNLRRRGKTHRAARGIHRIGF